MSLFCRPWMFKKPIYIRPARAKKLELLLALAAAWPHVLVLGAACAGWVCHSSSKHSMTNLSGVNWQWELAGREVPRRPPASTPQRAPDLDFGINLAVIFIVRWNLGRVSLIGESNARS